MEPEFYERERFTGDVWRTATVPESTPGDSNRKHCMAPGSVPHPAHGRLQIGPGAIFLGGKAISCERRFCGYQRSRGLAMLVREGTKERQQAVEALFPMIG